MIVFLSFYTKTDGTEQTCTDCFL